jgi:hypothetical protein
VIELKSSKLPTFVKCSKGQILLAGLSLLSASSVLLLSGCSSAFNPGQQQPLDKIQISGMHGKLHGAQAPVVGATVQIYDVPDNTGITTTYGSQAVPVGTAVTSTGPGGFWDYGTYSCAPTDELYVVATGGNAGEGTNANLSLMSAIGPCSSVTPTTFVSINEVTTVATAYALSGFMTSYTNVGTTPTNVVGLTNAFATVNNLVNITTGQANSQTPYYANNVPANAPPDVFRSIVPNDTINAIANALAACVNTNGIAAPGCSNSGGPQLGLFDLTPGITDTADAALYIAKHPGSVSPSQLWGLSSGYVQFQPTLTAAPADWTLTLNFIGGGLGGVNGHTTSGAIYIAIDGQGNVWIPNALQASITELNNLGVPLSPTTTVNSASPYLPITLGGWQGGGLSSVGPAQVAIDLNGNVWVTDQNDCLAEFNGTSGAAISPSGGYTGVCPNTNGINGLTIDPSDNVWVSGSDWVSSANATSLSSNTARSGFPITSGFNTLTGFLGSDYSGNVWWIDEGGNDYGAIETSGTTLPSSVSGSVLSSPIGFAAFGLDSGSGGGSGLNLWIPEGTGTQNLQPVNVTGSYGLAGAFLPSSEQGPNGIAADGNNSFYFGNDGGDVIPTNLTVVKSNGGLISPAINGYQGGSTHTQLNSPGGVAVDQSGNVWVVNTNRTPSDPGDIKNGGINVANVTEFVGLAAPVNPVLAQDAKNSTYAKKP